MTGAWNAMFIVYAKLVTFTPSTSYEMHNVDTRIEYFGQGCIDICYAKGLRIKSQLGRGKD